VTAFFVYAISIPLGIVKAIRHRTPGQHDVGAIFVVMPVPGFALGAVWSTCCRAVPDFSARRIPIAGAEALLPWRRPWMSSGIGAALIAYLIGAFAIDTMLMKNSLMEKHEARLCQDRARQGVELAPRRLASMPCGIPSFRWRPASEVCSASSWQAAS